MEVIFQSKIESNKKQQEDFLRLAPMERFYRFLKLSELSIKLFPIKNNKQKSNNFIIIIKE